MVIRLDAEFLGRGEDAEGFDDFFRRLDLNPVVVHLVQDLAELLGRFHRNNPFAVFVMFGNHLGNPQSRESGRIFLSGTAGLSHCGETEH